MGSVYSPSVLLLFARVAGLAVAVLVLIWALAFKSSFLTPSLSQQDLLYAVHYTPFFLPPLTLQRNHVKPSSFFSLCRFFILSSWSLASFS